MIYLIDHMLPVSSFLEFQYHIWLLQTELTILDRLVFRDAHEKRYGYTIHKHTYLIMYAGY